MLRTRILTALVLLPAALYLIFGSTVSVFAWVAAALLMVGCWEFRALAAVDASVTGWVLAAVQCLLLLYLLLTPTVLDDASTLLLACCFAWLMLFLRLPAYSAGNPVNMQYRTISVISAICVISAGWYALTWIRAESQGEWWLMLLLLIIWAADVGAYFFGRALGRHKLAPTISPGKTREGLVGGLLTALVVGFVAQRLFPLEPVAWQALAGLIVVTALTSACGDLFISLHKRTVGLKDTGKLFPGHGGVLDRLDSLLAAAPFFALGKLWLAP